MFNNLASFNISRCDNYFCIFVARKVIEKTMSKKIPHIILLILLITNCTKTDISDNAARLRIKLTNSPMLMISDESMAVREIKLHIQSIEVAVTDTTSVEVGEWIPLDFSGGQYNMLSLTNGKNTQLVDQYFPAFKTIRRVKIKLGNNNRIITTSVQNSGIELIIPQEISEGIVLNVNENLYANIISSLVIDIRALITETNGNYFLNPTIRVFSEVATGSIKGYVAPIEAQAIVSVVNEIDTFFSFPESDGMFVFPGLREGKWKIGIFPNQLSGFKDTIFTDSVLPLKITELKPNPIRLHPISNNP